MKVLPVRNVQAALYHGLRTVQAIGVRRSSRAGDVLVCQDPVTTEYHRSNERVLFFPQRDANPFFHFMEGLWMLAGRNDVAWISQFSSNIAQFSDDGVTFHGAYGKRWRNYFPNVYEDYSTPKDQLSVIAQKLRDNPEDRRCVLQMWDAPVDLCREGKDVPCNLMIQFQISANGFLNMTVFNRSNDIVWGAYGANAVHFSMLHEVMAAWIGAPLGRYWQVSGNWHAYLDTYEKCIGLTDGPLTCPYTSGEVAPYPMVNTDIATWFDDLSIFMEEGPIAGFRDKFFRRVAIPLYQSWMVWRNKEDPNRMRAAIKFAEECKATDWRKACVEWLQRRMK